MTASHELVRTSPPLRHLGVLTLAAAALVAGGRSRAALAVDEVHRNPANDHWYKYVDVSPAADWGTCRAAAESAGGYLVTITTLDENTWIAQALDMASRAPCWLGASDAAAEGSWVWEHGDVWDASNWAPGEPSDYSGAENWLAMAPDGTWTDEAATQALSGYIVEWDSDPDAVAEPVPPAPPTNLAAAYAPGSGVRLTWDDNSADESGFVVERMPAGFSFSVRKTADADKTTWTDFALFPSETYTYRVAAFNVAGASAYSNEVSVTTSASEAVPAPPKAPSALAAAASATPAVDLTWLDNSDDEILFDLERAEGGAAFGKATSLPAGTVAFSDGAVHPGWPYSYRIRALGLQGPSAFTNAVTVTVPATLDVTMTTGSLKHASKAARDSVKLAASLAFPLPSPDAVLDPVGHGLSVQYGPAAAPVAVRIPANDPGWKVKVRRGTPVKATWKSPKGQAPKVSVTVDLASGGITLSATGADFAADPSANVRLLVACGSGCGADTRTWTLRKPGVLQLR